MSAASDFLCHLLDSIDNPKQLLGHFKGIIKDDPLIIIRKILDISDRILCDALGKVLEGERDLAIVVHELDDMGRWGDDFLTAVSTFIGNLSERSPGLKALLTIGPLGGSGVTLDGLPGLKIHYDSERKGLIALPINARVSNVANKCRMP
jgi:hypothetical protein